jgi:hypothetical protein
LTRTQWIIGRPGLHGFLSFFMRKWLRTALVGLLMLALPVQAMAAFAMQNCQPAHDGDATHQMPAHCSEHAAITDADSSIPGTHHPVGATSCSLCAFCVSAVVIGLPLAHAGQMHSAHPPPLPNERLLSIVPDTPERPPRFSSC